MVYKKLTRPLEKVFACRWRRLTDWRFRRLLDHREQKMLDPLVSVDTHRFRRTLLLPGAVAGVVVMTTTGRVVTTAADVDDVVTIGAAVGGAVVDSGMTTGGAVGAAVVAAIGLGTWTDAQSNQLWCPQHSYFCCMESTSFASSVSLV